MSGSHTGKYDDWMLARTMLDAGFNYGQIILCEDKPQIIMRNAAD